VHNGSDPRAASQKAGRRGKHTRPRSNLPPGVAKLRLADKDSLAGKASRALGWSFFSTFLTRLSTFGVGVILARLLGPHAFGIYAVAFVALLAMQTFNELGVSLAIVRWEGDPQEIIPTVATVSVLVSILIYIGCFLIAPTYAAAMGVPAATSVVRVLAVAILIDGFANVPSGLLQRQFRQGRSTVAVQVGGWLGTGANLALAWFGYGAMSLAIGQVVGALACAALLVAFVPESLRFGFDPSQAKSLLRFGLPLAGSNLIAFAVTSVDQVIVGHMLGAKLLGFYVLALNLAGWPISMFSQPVANVAPAVFSRLQHDHTAMRNTFLAVARLLCAVALPACLFISGAADPLISFVYGVTWLPSARPLLWLGVLAAARIFFLLAYDYLAVLRRSHFLLIVQLVWLLALIPALIFGARLDGIYGAALMEAAVATFVVLPCYLAGLIKRGVRPRALARAVCLPAIGAAIVGLAAHETAKLAPNNFIALAVSGAIAAAIVAILAYRNRGVLALLRPAPGGQAKPSDSTVAIDTKTTGTASTDGLTAELETIWRVIESPPTSKADRIASEPAWHDAFPPRPVYHDLTGPLPVYRDVSAHLRPRRDLSETSPLYRLTAASLQWDPASTPYRANGTGRANTNSHVSVDDLGERTDMQNTLRPKPRTPTGVPDGIADYDASAAMDLLIRLSQRMDEHPITRARRKGPDQES
jgi:O-antigen/teichoic acid export membrane protein